MNRRVVMGIVIALLVVIGAVAAGGYAYSVGRAQGAMESAQIVVPGEDGAAGRVLPYYVYGPGFGRWGWGFGPLGCLFPILGFFLFFFLLRGLFWGAGWGWGRRGWGGDGNGRQAMFEEWHRRAHGEAPPAERPSSNE